MKKEHYYLLFTYLFGVFYSVVKIIPTLKYSSTGAYPFVEFDSFYFMEQVNSMFSDISHFEYNEVFSFDLYSIILGFFSFISPFDIETISFYSPAIISPLIVIPLYLLFKKYGDYRIGLLSAIILNISNFYSFRTQIGFSDTDNGIAFFFLISLFYLVSNKKNFQLFFSLLFFQWWYTNAIILIFPAIFIWAIYRFIKKEEFINNLLFAAAALFPFFFIFKILLLPIVFLIRERSSFRFKFISTLFLLLISLKPFFLKIFYKFHYFFLHSNTSIKTAGSEVINSNIFTGLMSDARYVTESKPIKPLELLDVVGLMSAPLTLISIIGFYFMYKNFRELFFILIPTFLLGLASIFLGIRFIYYLEISLSISLAISIFFIYQKLSFNKISQLVFVFLLLFFTYPAVIEESKDYLIMSSFKKEQIAISLKKVSNQNLFKKNSFLMSPTWDYGHALRFYSKSIVDRSGLYHSSIMNYYVSNIFTHNSELAYKHIKNYARIFKMDTGTTPFSTVKEFKNAFKSFNKLKDIEDFNIYKEIYVVLPLDLEYKNVFRDMDRKNEKAISYKFYAEFKRNPLYLEYNSDSNKIQTKSGAKPCFKRISSTGEEIILDKEASLIYDISGENILVYDKNIEDTLIIDLYKNDSKYFNLIYHDKTIMIFKMKEKFRITSL